MVGVGPGLDVTVRNYVRAESDFQLKGYVEKFDCFGRLVHVREPYDVHDQVTVRGNRDTLYSWSVFDLGSPVTFSLPDPKGRYQSLMSVSQDHSIDVFYGPGEVTFSEDNVGTRYVILIIRTFMDPSDEVDVEGAHRLQDQVSFTQGDKGVFELPDWDKQEVEEMRNTINRARLAAYLLLVPGFWLAIVWRTLSRTIWRSQTDASFGMDWSRSRRFGVLAP